MPSFDYFVNTGNKWDIKPTLFGDADRAGIDSGNQQKTDTQAIVEGITTGAKEGLAIAGQVENIQTSNLQQEAMAQQNAARPEAQKLDLERQRLINEYYPQQQQAQLENSQLINQIKALDLKNQTQNETLALRKTAQELKTSTAQNELAESVAKGRDYISDALSKPDLAGQKSILNNKDAVAAMHSDPELARQVVETLGRTKAITTEEYNSFSKSIETDAEQRMRMALEERKIRALEKETADFDTLEDKVTGDSAEGAEISNVMNNAGFVDKADMVDKIVTYPSGMKRKPKGYIVHGKDIAVASTTPITSYDAFDNTGKFLGVITPKANSMLSQYQRKGGIKYGLKPMQPVYGDVDETPTPTPTPSRFDAPSADTKPSTNLDPITVQQYGKLMEEAKGNPAMQAAIEKRMNKGKASTPAPTAEPTPPATPQPTAAPTAQATPQAPASTPALPGAEKVSTEETEADVNADVIPVSAVEKPKILKATEVYKALPKHAQKFVEPETLQKVADLKLLAGHDNLSKAIVAVESGGDINAKSPTGAIGLFQMTKPAVIDAEKKLTRNTNTKVKLNRHDPIDNVRGGIAYFNILRGRYEDKGGDVAALMAYNVGMGVMDAVIEEADGDYSFETLAFELEQLPTRGKYTKLLTPDKLKETLSYPRKVLAYKTALDAMTTGKSGTYV